MCADCESERPSVSRRVALRLGVGAAAAANLALRPAPLAAHAAATERRLALYNLHTEERLRTTYWVDGAYVAEAVAELNYILRDFRTGDIADIDLALFDLLWALRRRVDSAEPYELISGYRSPQTNAMLRRTTDGVAKNSLHVHGMASDVRLPGRDVGRLRRAAVALARGGVGYYPDTGFIHVDVGPVRYW